MKKKLYLIGGTMGVGKTTTSLILKEKLDNTVFLDGDWCWDMSPFVVNEETKTMVMDNIVYLLNNYIKCSVYENIIFCWVMHEQSIIDEILSKLDTDNVEVKVISLVCNKEALTQRLQKDVECHKRKADVIERSVARIDLYNQLNSIKVDVSNINAIDAANKIINL